MICRRKISSVKKAATDTRLLDVALDQFGQKGFDGASTREIAKAANTAMSSITYHYGGKEGLYLATAEFVGQEIAKRHPISFNQLIDFTALNKTEALAILESIFMSMMDFFLSEHSARLSRFVMREQMQPTAAFEVIFNNTFKPMADHACAILNKCTDGRLSDEEARIAVMAIFGQSLVFRSARQSVLRVANWPDLTPERADKIKEQVRAHFHAIMAIYITQD